MAEKNHILITRLWFDNKELMRKYLDVADKTFVPAVKNQICKNFVLGILLKAEDVEEVRKRVGIEFIAFTGGIEQYRRECLKYNIQSRVDIDDWIADDYVEKIQQIYDENIEKYSSFIIHAQPQKKDFVTGKITKMAEYHDRRISMFATLCQKNPVVDVFKVGHGQLYELGEEVFKISEGRALWVQHKDSTTNTLLRTKNKIIGNMDLSDVGHNWLNERNTEPVLNILTRTFRRPLSFERCRKSILAQTYKKINHIVGCQEECYYFPAAHRVEKKDTGRLPHNLYLNEFGQKVKTGWVMYLDDDDEFKRNDAAQIIIDNCKDEDTLLIWKVSIGDVVVPEPDYWEKIVPAHISGIGFAFHSKHLPLAQWQPVRRGDYDVIVRLSQKLKVKWLDEVLTGTQNSTNSRGKIPEYEKTGKIEEREPIIKGMATVGTPTWNNRDIFWLSIESLCRQRTSYPWEYIVFECPGEFEVGEDFIEKYKERLIEAGCKRILYINKGQKIDLSTKWLEIARRARGEVLILHDSDDFTHPLRIQKTMEQIGDNEWYETRYAWHFNLKEKNLLLFDSQSCGKWWKTGFNIAIKTEYLRKKSDKYINKGIHAWLIENCKTRIIDEEIYPCVATTGMNTISLNRIRNFSNPRPPFKKTEETIKTIGLPDDIIEKLLNGQVYKSSIEMLRLQDKYLVEFLRNYCRLYKTGERRYISGAALKRLIGKNIVKIINEEQVEKNIEL